MKYNNIQEIFEQFNVQHIYHVVNENIRDDFNNFERIEGYYFHLTTLNKVNIHKIQTKWFNAGTMVLY